QHNTPQKIIRDYNKKQIAKQKNYVKKIVKDLETTYGESSIHLKLMDQYYNMREKIAPVKEVVDIAEQAMHNLQITPIIEPIRGGTDGAQLSYKGLPTPNIFTGGMNFHGKYEFISVQDMQMATKTIVEICELFTKKELSKN